jgi:hypothetical protein
MIKRASPPLRQQQGGTLALRRSVADTSLVTGCIKPDPTANNAGVYIKAGDTGCDASDHLEIDYINGDQLDISYTGTSSSYDLKVTVPAGSWAGTSLDYAATVLGGNSGVSIHATGGMKYQSAIDSAFDFSYQVSVTADSAGQGSALQTNGSSTDHLKSLHLAFRWTTTIQLDVHSQLSALDWAGNQEVELLKPDGSVQDDVKWSNVHVRAAYQGSPPAVSGFTASGDILWNGARAGSVVLKDPNDVVIRWTDGTDSAVDPLALFGSPLG